MPWGPSVKEAMRSDGTPFATIGDSNITAGVLVTNGQPRYPILISLASEAIRDDEIAPLTNYVAAHPHSALAQLSAHGKTYTNASASQPSDSFPGLVALVTGGSPTTTGF